MVIDRAWERPLTHCGVVHRSKFLPPPLTDGQTGGLLRAKTCVSQIEWIFSNRNEALTVKRCGRFYSPATRVAASLAELSGQHNLVRPGPINAVSILTLA